MLFSMLAVPVLAQRKAGDVKITPYVFENSKKEKIDAELGVLLVPENRGKPQSNLIELAFVRFKSTSKNPGAPVVYLAGGPGGSGVGTAKGTRFPLFLSSPSIKDVMLEFIRGGRVSTERIELPPFRFMPLTAGATN
jgi:hypothetical protein